MTNRPFSLDPISPGLIIDYKVLFFWQPRHWQCCMPLGRMFYRVAMDTTYNGTSISRSDWLFYYSIASDFYQNKFYCLSIAYANKHLLECKLHILDMLYAQKKVLNSYKYLIYRAPIIIKFHYTKIWFS